jgi:hypothetical protein
MSVVLPFFYAADHLGAGAPSTAAAGSGSINHGGVIVEQNVALGRPVFYASGGERIPIDFPAISSVTVGTRAHGVHAILANIYFVGLFAGASQLISLEATGVAGTLVVRINGVVHTTSVALENVWAFWELHAQIHPSAGVVTVKRDGSEVFTISGVDTGSVGVSNLMLQPNHGIQRTADIYIREAPTEGNPFYGPIVNRWLAPAADVGTPEWTRNGGSSNAGRLLNPFDGDTSYIETQDLGDADRYTMADLPSGINSIIAVVPVTTAIAPNGGAPQVAVDLITGAGEIAGAAHTVGVSTYQTQVGTARTEKPGGGGWGIADVDALNLRIRAA